jgi:hypothetical protein
MPLLPLPIKTKKTSNITFTVKGTVFVCFWFFFMNQFTPAPEYPIRTVLNFFKNLRRYLQVKVHHWYQRHWWQILPPVLLVLLIPVENMPPVSTIPAANLPAMSMTPVAICQRYQRHRWQICQWCQ